MISYLVESDSSSPSRGGGGARSGAGATPDAARRRGVFVFESGILRRTSSSSFCFARISSVTLFALLSTRVSIGWERKHATAGQSRGDGGRGEGMRTPRLLADFDGAKRFADAATDQSC